MGVTGSEAVPHKLRGAMAAEAKGHTIGGAGKVAELDAGWFGGYVRAANLKEHRADRRFRENQSGKRKAVIVIRERDGNSLPAVGSARAGLAMVSKPSVDFTGCWQRHLNA
jgi:hypothetical protein